MKGKGWSQLQLSEPFLGEEEQKREEISCTRLIWGLSWRELNHQ